MAPSALNRRLSGDAYHRVTEMIMSGLLEAGAMIQERALAEELGLSRTPLREALLLLEGEGVLVREGPRILRVMHMDLGSYMENLAIRRLLETEAARLSVGRISKATLDNVETHLRELMIAEKDGAPVLRQDVRAVDETLHTTMSEAAGNRQLAEIIRNLRRRTHIFDLKNVPERFHDTCLEHLAIVAALRPGGTPDEAAMAVERHIAAIRSSIIARLLPH